ncbi:hypothetical protein [Bradyrhizobium japonicum]|nr:hypothetical protein [Bradyrhizobium japonicum]
MSVKLLLAEILQNELTARGVDTLAPSDYEQIAERLVEQVRDIELSLSARSVTGKPEFE